MKRCVSLCALPVSFWSHRGKVIKQTKQRTTWQVALKLIGSAATICSSQLLHDSCCPWRCKSKQRRALFYTRCKPSHHQTAGPILQMGVRCVMPRADYWQQVLWFQFSKKHPQRGGRGGVGTHSLYPPNASPCYLWENGLVCVKVL